MKKRTIFIAAFLTATIMYSACDEERLVFDYPIVKLGPLGAGDYVYVGNGTTARLTVIKTPEGKTETIEIPNWTVGLYSHPDGKKVIALSHLTPMLSIIEGNKITKEIALRSRYDDMKIRVDGKIGALFFSADNSKRNIYSFDERFVNVEGASSAVNLNELSFVNLDSGEARVITLTSSSMKGPNQIIFANPQTGDAPSENLAAILLDTGVAVCDVLKGGEAEGDVPCRLIPLVNTSSGSNYIAVEALFSADNKYLFVRTSNLDDIAAVRLDYDGKSIEASLNVMTSPFSGLSSIHILEGENYKDNLLAVYASRRGVAMLNAESKSEDEFKIENLVVSPSVGATIMNDGGSQYLVAADNSYNRIIIVDIERKDYKAVQTVGRITKFILSPDKMSAAMISQEKDTYCDDYYYGYECYGYSYERILEIGKFKMREEGEPIKFSVATISLNAPYGDHSVSKTGDMFYSILPGSGALVAVDLKAFTTSEVKLEEGSFFALGITGSENALFVEDYEVEGNGGRLMIIPTGAKFSRKESKVVEGYLFGDLFDLPEEEYDNE
ncbi:MAG: hypothetical protein Kow0090_12270 [Myxococcota bacterium]